MSETRFDELVDEILVTDDAALTQRLRANELEIRRLTAEQAAITTEVRRRRSYLDDGHRSVASYLRAELAYSNRQATQTVRVAQLLDTVPGCGDAFLNGHIGTDQASELARCRANPRVGDQLAESADVLLDAAEHMKFDDFRIVAKRWESLADTDGAEQRAAAGVEHRDATLIDAGGELFLRATGGTALEIAELASVFDSFTEHEFRLDCAERDQLHGPDAPSSLLGRTDKQRRRDALQHIFRAARTAAEAGLVVGPVPTVVNIITSHFDAEHALAADGLVPAPTDLVCPPLPQRRKETASGSPVTDSELVQALIHDRVRSVVMDGTGMPISYGRTRRLFTGPIRDMAKLLGHRCAHPGCSVAAEQCQVDHVEEFATGDGTTSIANAGLECSSHNRFKHRTKLSRIRHSTDRVTTTRADGTQMAPVGRRRVRVTAPTTHTVRP